MMRTVNRATRSIQRGFRTADRAVNRFGKGLKTVAVRGGAGLAVLGLALGAVTRIGATFEQTLVNAAVKFPEGIRRGTEAFKRLGDVARRIGATTEFTATQAASGLNFLAMAGFNAVQSVAALPGLVNLATAAQIDLALASDIATDSLGAFGLAVKDPLQLSKNLARVNDVLVKTATSANTTIEAMFEAIVKGAPAFTNAGQSMESFSALIGVMANSGIKGAEAGTILKNTIIRLSDPVSKAAKIIKKLGIRVADSRGNFRDILDIMQDFEKGLKTMGTVERSAALSTVFGSRAISGLSVALKEGTISIAKYRKMLLLATGTSKEMATAMRDTLQGSINSAKSAFEGLIITVSFLKNESLRGLIDRVTEVIRNFDKVIETNDVLVTSLVDGTIEAVKGAVGVFGLLVGSFVVLKTTMIVATVVTKAYTVAVVAMKVGLFAARLAMMGLNLAMRANPVGLVITAIAALITLGGLLIANWGNIVAAVKSAVRSIVGFLAVLAKPFENLISGFSKIIGAAKTLGGIKVQAPPAKPFIGEGFSGRGAEIEARRTGGQVRPQVISASAQLGRELEARRQEINGEIRIKDETGRAEITRSSTSGVGLTLETSGAF